jgi:hypothetical protein
VRGNNIHNSTYSAFPFFDSNDLAAATKDSIFSSGNDPTNFEMIFPFAECEDMK